MAIPTRDKGQIIQNIRRMGERWTAELITYDGANDIARYTTLAQAAFGALDEVHGVKTARYWNVIAHWYIMDSVKSYEYIELMTTQAYDSSGFKSAIRGDLAGWSKRTCWRNIIEAARDASGRRGIGAYATKLKYTLQYVSYRIRKRKWRRHIRSRLDDYARQIEDPRLSAAVRCMPTIFVEDLSIFQQLSTRRPRSLLTPMMRNAIAVSCAESIDQGMPLDLIQHGAFYGEAHEHVGTTLEMHMADNFKTWGWTLPGTNTVAHYSSKLARFCGAYEIVRDASRNSMRRSTGQPAQTMSDVVLVALPLPGLSRNEQAEFMSRLAVADLDIGSRSIVVRARDHSRSAYMFSDYGEWMREIGHWIEIDDGSTPSHVAMARSDLVILIHHPATMFFEALAVDHPVVALARPIDKYRPEYRPYVHWMLDVGLLASTVEELVSWVHRLGPERKLWWSHVRDTPQYVDLKHTYARIDPMAD